MGTDPRDDFSIFDDHAHMFFNLKDPFELIRDQVEETLRAQVEGTQVASIRAHGEPKWLTLGRKVPDQPDKVAVGHFALCFLCSIAVESPGHAESLEAAVTLAFRDIDRPGEERMRLWMDLFADAEAAHRDETLEERFLAFRHGQD